MNDLENLNDTSCEIYNVLVEIRDLLKSMVATQDDDSSNIIANIMTGNDVNNDDANETTQPQDFDDLRKRVKDLAHEMMNDEKVTRKDIKAQMQRIAGKGKMLDDLNQDELLELELFLKERS